MLVEAVDDDRRAPIEPGEPFRPERRERHAQGAGQVLLAVDRLGQYVHERGTAGHEIQEFIDIDACGHAHRFPTWVLFRQEIAA